VKLEVTSEADGIPRLACEGTIAQEKFSRDQDPMTTLTGPGIFAKKVLLSLEKAVYIDSSGISWLLICHKHFLQGGGRLILHSVPPLVMKVLQIVQLPKIVSIAADEADALKLAKG
jgi:anti-anti-sigma factor